MTKRQTPEPVLSLPVTAKKAGQIFYGVMCAGFISVPIILMVFRQYIEPSTVLSLREFFWIFTVIYLVTLVLCKGPTTKVLASLRNRLDGKPSAEVTVLVPAAANSSNPDIVALGRKYWFWQLIGGYLTGVFFSWVGGIFFFFVL
jgi:hypothetical protein